MATPDIAWASRWRAVLPDAQYNPSFGLETAWRENADEWGYPLEDNELDVEHNGQTYRGRTFSGVGMVIWTDDGADIIGWP